MYKTAIEWCDMAWNPVTGCLGPDGEGLCPYCYARKQARRRGDDNFLPTLHKKRLALPAGRKKPTVVFVCSMADLFGDWVSDEWIEKVFDTCKAAPQHTYLFLTKNPKRYSESKILEEFENHKNWWAGFSANNEFEYLNRYRGIKVNPDRIFVSFEPLLEGDISLTMPLDYTGHELDPLSWLIVGSETRNGKSVNMPKRERILDIREQCQDLNIPLFEKDSLLPLGLPGGLIRQWPEGIKCSS